MNTHTRATSLDGAHPSQLALELYLRQAHAHDELEAIARHLAQCERCRAQLDAMRAFDADWPRHELPADLDALLSRATPSSAPPRHDDSPSARRPPASPVHPRAHASWRRAAKPALLFAVACAALFALTRSAELPRPLDDASGLDPHTTLSPTDIVRRKSATFRLDVFVHNGERARLAIDGEQVYPGERVGFQISASRAGYLLIAGRDEKNNTYLGYPQDLDGEAILLEELSGAQPLKLDQALLLDDVLGTETLVAMYCPAPFSFEELEPALTHDASAHDLATHRGCVVQTVTLNKLAPPQQ